MAGPQDLFNLAQEYLGACADGAAAAPGGAISRSFVSPGLPSLDCVPQLAVYVGGTAEADTIATGPQLAVGRRPDQMGRVHLIALTCVVARCSPDMPTTQMFPTPAQLNSASAEVCGDLWAIWHTVRAQYIAGTIFTRPDGIHRELYFDPAVPISISGGACGWMIPVRVELDGYSP